MKHRDKAGGKAARTQRTKTLKISNAAKKARPGSSVASGKETNTARIARERDEASEQLTATSEVLKIISSSPGDLERVFQSILENATRICGAEFGTLYLSKEDAFYAAAFHNAPPAFIEARKNRPLRPDPESTLSRVARTKQAAQVLDSRKREAYRKGDPFVVAGADLGGYRTIMSVPMLNKDKLVGVISIYRQEVRPFTDKQIELVKHFAAQAVIAIENTRLFNELRQRTDDLSEALEQQTATSEVLQVISSSPGELAPVFEAMLKNATRVCGAKFGILFRYEGGSFHPAAMLDVPPAFAGFLRRQGAFQPKPGQLFGRLCESKDVIQVDDRTMEPDLSPSARYAGARSSIAVPMLKEGELVGAFFIYRTEVRPFADKQIELVRNFAAQAVIAIENTRLLNELRESLQQQTATADVLKVISRSTFNLPAVLDKLIESACHLCEAEIGTVRFEEGDRYRLAATYGCPPEWHKHFAGYSSKPDLTSVFGQTIIKSRTVHIPDVLLDPDYARPEAQKLMNLRAALGVPLMLEGRVFGVVNLFRSTPQPFTQKQIELAETFADQAVIAIKNTRMFEAEQQRTRELSESLEQQTATSAVLKVISSSPGELEPVFNAMLENAVRICEARFGVMWRFRGDENRPVAMLNLPPSIDEFLRQRGWLKPTPGSDLDILRESKQPVHTLDMASSPHPTRMAKSAGVRTQLAVPMLLDKELVGAITIYRQEVRPFTEKQIELVKNFAAQAVIAIENTRLLNELKELLQQQTATSEVLKVISSSPGELQPVFQAILENATRICDAGFGAMSLLEGQELRSAALFNAPPEMEELRRRQPAVPRDTPVGRVVETKQVVHFPDVTAVERYANAPLVKHAGVRSIVAVPMLKDDELIGVIAIYRKEVRPFTDKQIALVSNFASQAVIAIENARLLNELRQRTDDLSEALEQQTATSKVLQVISSSPGELEPVFQSILENATRICEAKFGTLWRFDDGAARIASNVGIPPAFAEFLARGPHRPSPLSPISRVIKTRERVHIADYRLDQCFLEKDPLAIAGVELGGIRTLFVVPLLKDNQLVGAIGIFRQEVRPFTDKQINLVSSFAAQAVIAIENARLLNELRQRTDDLAESLEQQIATAEILQVISNSVNDTQPVFDAIVESGSKLFPGALVSVALRSGGTINAAAIAETDPARAEAWRRTISRTPLAREYMHGAALLDRRIVDIPDVADAPAEFAAGARNFLTSGYRAITIIPMMRGDEAIGLLSVVRLAAGPLSDKQAAVLRTFANQAVIAIENTRLLNELRQRTDDLSEALEQQTATAEILQVISNSLNDTQPVFDAIVKSAVALFPDSLISIALRDGDMIRGAAAVAVSDPVRLEAWRRTFPYPLTREYMHGKAILDCQIVDIPDVKQAPSELAVGARNFLTSGYRAITIMPMIRGDAAIGAISVIRGAPGPLSDKQTAVLKAFAAQAVIAIENTRLLTELRQRTDDLAESLEQQTATSEVLKVISSSPGDLQPVFDAMLANATKLCEASYGAMWLWDDSGMRAAALHGALPEAYLEHLRGGVVLRPSPDIPGVRAMTERKPIQVTDLREDPAYLAGDPLPVAAVEDAGIRTLVCVPMYKDDQPVGNITIYRREVRPFSDKQVELLANFAAQAVIAIENARLLSELRQRTADLSKSLEDLRTAQDRLVQTEKLASLGQLTAGIAHEIKNPLNFVNNFSAVSVELIDELREALAGANLDARLRGEISELADMLQGNLDKVVQHGKRADSIVKNMLLHSRAGSGEHRPVDINALVEESLNLAYHGARAEKQGFNITMEKSLDPAAGEVDLFPQEITRVLLNLISNGFYAATRRKADGNGGEGYEPILATATRNLGDRVEIRIRDNGTGIPPEVKEKMFNPFFTTKPAGEGTGLGLSISHDIIVKQHGGSIEVDTKPGQYTEFTIILPRLAATIAPSGDRP